MASLPLSAARQLLADRLAEGDPEDALSLTRRIAERFPRDYRIASLAGRAHLARGEMEAARAEFERVAAVLPDERDAWADLAACGSERAAALLPDLPPLPSQNGDRPPISPAALGHLYLRQFLLTHCTAQLEPLWRADASRLDVGVALAEAYWRLDEIEPAEEICRAIVAAAPDCLKANLVLAQLLAAAGRRDDAAPFLAAAQAVDPENTLAEDLYQWLAVRDPALAPLRGREVMVDVDEAPSPVVPGPTPFWEKPEEAPVGDVAETSPEPALALAEIESERTETVPLPHSPSAQDWERLEPALSEAKGEGSTPTPVHWLKLAGHGPLRSLGPRPHGDEQAVAAWNESCKRIGERFGLGAPQSSSMQSAGGMVQLLHEQGAITVALARASVNPGFLRAKLRKEHTSS